MKLRSLIITLAAVVITATTLSGCIVVPDRGYFAGPYHAWGYERGHDRGYDRR
jgi:hypothetical protein